MAGGGVDRAHRQPLITTSEQALREAATLGPFFTISLPGQAPTDVRWRPFTPIDEQVLADQLAALGRQLGTDEPRPGASILHLGAASAICAPLLATAAAAGIVPPLDPDQLLFGFRDGGPLQLAALAIAPARPSLLPELAEQLIAVGIGAILGPFTAALTALVSLPQGTLTGNVFSALAAAARLVEPPAAGARARALVDLVARRHAPLHGAGVLNWRAIDATDPKAYFQRRNCCLFYRVPGGGICGDCILSD